jgi:hypothetical protein
MSRATVSPYICSIVCCTAINCCAMTPFRGWLDRWQVLFDVFCAGIRSAFLNVRLFPSRVFLLGAYFYCTQYPEGEFARRFNRFHIEKSASTILTNILVRKTDKSGTCFQFRV